MSSRNSWWINMTVNDIEWPLFVFKIMFRTMPHLFTIAGHNEDSSHMNVPTTWNSFMLKPGIWFWPWKGTQEACACYGGYISISRMHHWIHLLPGLRKEMLSAKGDPCDCSNNRPQFPLFWVTTNMVMSNRKHREFTWLILNDIELLLG